MTRERKASRGGAVWTAACLIWLAWGGAAEGARSARTCGRCHGSGTEERWADCSACNGRGVTAAPLTGCIEALNAVGEMSAGVDNLGRQLKHKDPKSKWNPSQTPDPVRCRYCNGTGRRQVTRACSRCGGSGVL